MKLARKICTVSLFSVVLVRFPAKPRVVRERIYLVVLSTRSAINERVSSANRRRVRRKGRKDRLKFYGPLETRPRDSFGFPGLLHLCLSLARTGPTTTSRLNKLFAIFMGISDTAGFDFYRFCILYCKQRLFARRVTSRCFIADELLFNRQFVFTIFFLLPVQGKLISKLFHVLLCLANFRPGLLFR